MRNLAIETQKVNLLNFLLLEGYHCCYNCDNDKYYLVKDDNRLVIIDALENSEYVDHKVFLKKKEVTIKPVGIEYCSIIQEIYIAYDTGIVVCVSGLDQAHLKFDEIADFPDGLQSMKISPDHEAVVLMTKDNVVITLSSNFDILQEVSKHALLWAKKTCFHLEYLVLLCLINGQVAFFIEYIKFWLSE